MGAVRRQPGPSRIAHVTAALGWAGTALDGIRLLDTRLTVLLDPASRPDAPALSGVLVPVRGSWRPALSLARSCLAFAPAVLLFDAPEVPTELCLLECGYAEVGVVLDAADGVRVGLPPRPRRPARTHRRAIDRALDAELAAQLGN